MTVTASMLVATLKDKAENHIMNAINFEEIKARVLVIIFRNKAMGTRLLYLAT